MVNIRLTFFDESIAQSIDFRFFLQYPSLLCWNALSDLSTVKIDSFGVDFVLVVTVEVSKSLNIYNALSEIKVNFQTQNIF